MEEIVSGLVHPEMGDAGEIGRGVHFYQYRRQWCTGAMVCWSDPGQQNAETCLVSLPGEALKWMSREKTVEVVEELGELGLRPRRVDLAVDSKLAGEDIQRVRLAYLEQAVQAVNRGCLVGARRVGVVRSRDGDGAPAGLTLYLGTRGKDGPGRFVRFYDKGLEQESGIPGWWLRWECEFTKSCAEKALAAMCVSYRTGDDSAMMGLALGAMDFREVTGRARLAQRPRLAFWSEFIGDNRVVMVRNEERGTGDYDAKVQWYRRCVLPGARALGEAFGMSGAEFLAAIEQGVKTSSEVRRSSAAMEARILERERQVPF